MAKDKTGKKVSTGDLMNTRKSGSNNGNFLKSILKTISDLFNSLLGLKKKNKMSFSL